MSNEFKPTPGYGAYCSICLQPVTADQAFHAVKQRKGTIWLHKACLEAEQKAAREGKA